MSWSVEALAWRVDGSLRGEGACRGWGLWSGEETGEQRGSQGLEVGPPSDRALSLEGKASLEASSRRCSGMGRVL